MTTHSSNAVSDVKKKKKKKSRKKKREKEVTQRTLQSVFAHSIAEMCSLSNACVYIRE